MDYTGKVISSTSLTANGVAGETAEFSAEDIRSAAQGALAAGYGFVDLSSVNGASVVYGEDGSVQIQVGKVATLQITYKRLGKVVGTATLTHVQTSGSAKTTFTTQEIKGAAPSGRSVISILGTSVKFGSTAKINATTL